MADLTAGQPEWDAAAALPTVQRQTARALLITHPGAGEPRLLLMQDSDAGFPGAPRWWMTPGGGIDPGESELEALVREVGEETGMRVDPAAVIGPVWRRRVRGVYSDKRVDQVELFYLVPVAPFTPSTDGFTPEERASVQGFRWWSLAELASTGDTVWPSGLHTFLTELLQRWESGGNFGSPATLPDELQLARDA